MRLLYPSHFLNPGDVGGHRHTWEEPYKRANGSQSAEALVFGFVYLCVCVRICVSLCPELGPVLRHVEYAWSSVEDSLPLGDMLAAL